MELIIVIIINYYIILFLYNYFICRSSKVYLVCHSGVDKFEAMGELPERLSGEYVSFN